MPSIHWATAPPPPPPPLNYAYRQYAKDTSFVMTPLCKCKASQEVEKGKVVGMALGDPM